MEFLQDSLSARYSEELGGQLRTADPLDRLREYTVDPCEDPFKVNGNFIFKAYDWPEIVNRLDEEEKAYRSWKEQQAQLKILMNSKAERPKKGNYNELLDLCLKDLKELPVLLPEDQKADADVCLYNRSIVRYLIKFFAVADEIDEVPIWGNSFLAQKHRKSLGFADQKFDQCRHSPANKDYGIYSLGFIKRGNFRY
ncbi:MAG: hypothetical protein ASARMPRED_004291 [Alectoria sarmentosa]|nr:MAG: hypothetical protein ASARMPRED_004291 [Alectoria sarmentosa]